MPLNYAALANDMPFERDTVESCVREVLTAFNRSLSSKRNVEFSFSGIGRLSIREKKVKMKFFKEFINSMDGSGQLLNALKDVRNFFLFWLILLILLNVLFSVVFFFYRVLKV